MSKDSKNESPSFLSNFAAYFADKRDFKGIQQKIIHNTEKIQELIPEEKHIVACGAVSAMMFRHLNRISTKKNERDVFVDYVAFGHTLLMTLKGSSIDKKILLNRKEPIVDLIEDGSEAFKKFRTNNPAIIADFSREIEKYCIFKTTEKFAKNNVDPRTRKLAFELYFSTLENAKRARSIVKEADNEILQKQTARSK